MDYHQYSLQASEEELKQLQWKGHLNQDGQDTWLHVAARKGDWAMIKFGLTRLPWLANANGNTPLHAAFLANQWHIVDLMLQDLVQANEFVNEKNHLGLSNVHIACSRENKAAIVGFLKVGTLSDVVSDDSAQWAGYNALHFAAIHDSEVAIKYLISLPDWQRILEVQSTDGKTPSQILLSKAMKQCSLSNLLSKGSSLLLHVMCTQPELSAGLKKFLADGADVNQRITPQISSQDSLLDRAVRNHCLETVRAILQYQPDLTLTNQQGMTPLHLAMYESDKAITELLYEATKIVNIDIVDENGLSFLHIACSRGDLTTVKIVLPNVTKGKLDGEVMHSKRFAGYTPLHFAVLNGHLDVVEYLIDCGVNINAGEGTATGSSLHLALLHAHVTIIEVLMKNGATLSVGSECNALITLVQACCDERNAEKIKKLLPHIEKLIDRGVDVNSKDEKKNTALHFAAEAGDRGSRCVELLLNYGADINRTNIAFETPFTLFMKSEFNLNTSPPGDYMRFYHHILKLKLLGQMIITCENEQCFKDTRTEANPKYSLTYVDFNEELLQNFEQSMVDEVEQLRATLLDCKVSLYDFITRHIDFVAEHADCRFLFELEERNEYSKKFPHYGFLIKLTHEKAKKFNSTDFVCSGATEEGLGGKRRRLSRLSQN